MAEPGTRVVRGQQWRWKNQDGGDGHVGTIISVNQRGGSKSVRVQWDTGMFAIYSLDNQRPLRVFDSAPTGFIA